MDRVLVEVLFPGMGRQYDFWIPKKMNIQTAIEKLSTEIAEFENNPIIQKKTELKILCSTAQGKILNPLDTIFSAGVQSGDTLILL